MHAASCDRRVVEPRFGWIAAVTPADARRFRVRDPLLAQMLLAAGASLHEEAPDVEIVPARDVRGDAELAVVALDIAEPDSRFRGVRGVQRIARSARIDLRTRHARRLVRRRGYAHTTVLRWEGGGPLPLGRDKVGRPTTAHRFPLNALVLGARPPTRRTMLEQAVASAQECCGRPLLPASVVVGSSGVLVCISSEGVLRVGMEPAASRIVADVGPLRRLRSSLSPEAASLVPFVMGHGAVGMTAWSVERALPGHRPAEPLPQRVLDDCIAVLSELFHAADADQANVPVMEAAEMLAAACEATRATEIIALAGRVEQRLERLPRGFVHGDFWSGNLLVYDGRLSGIVDWSAASAGRLPLVDLLHLEVSGISETERLRLGPALLRYRQRGQSDSAVRYCELLHLRLETAELDALHVAYWLEALARELVDPDRDGDPSASPAWLRENVDLVLGAARGWVP